MRIDTGWAKVNLALHVRRRRDDSYHEIETLFAFVDGGDSLGWEPGDETPSLTVTGPFGQALSDEADNLVLAVARQAGAGGRFTLDKRLPVAAGLGGGSADAAAAARLIAGTSIDLAPLGADIPACVASRTAIGRGTGTDLEPVSDNVAGLPILLVNPRIPLATGPVFRAWDGSDRGALSGRTAREIALAGRNDLEAPAIALCPVIAEILSALHARAPLLSRMSGSGATCFALFDDEGERDAAAVAMPDEWWTMTGRLR